MARLQNPGKELKLRKKKKKRQINVKKYCWKLGPGR